MKTKIKTNNNMTQLKNWLFTKPVMFALLFLLANIVVWLIYMAIQAIFNTDSLLSFYILFAIAFVLCTWYTIKKLPHESLNQNDFVAVTNGVSITSVFAGLVAVLLYGVGTKIPFSATYGVIFVLFILLTLFALYLLGLAICGIYAKYKRATTIGISKWRVILSMPFGFLLMWTPGYLIKAQNTKPTLEIKCKWYTKFNKWVMASFANTLFAFLFFLLCKGLFAGTPTLLLYLPLLTIYGIWYLVKKKSNFIKDINNGYALTAIGINIAILVAILIVRLYPNLMFWVH